MGKMMEHVYIPGWVLQPSGIFGADFGSFGDDSLTKHPELRQRLRSWSWQKPHRFLRRLVLGFETPKKMCEHYGESKLSILFFSEFSRQRLADKKLLTTRNGHSQSGWSPIACEGLYFYAMCKNEVSASGWSPIGCEGFDTNLNIPSPLPTTLVFHYSLWNTLMQLYCHIYIYINIYSWIWRFPEMGVPRTHHPHS